MAKLSRQAIEAAIHGLDTPGTRGLRFDAADLSGLDLSGLALTGASFRGTHLEATIFRASALDRSIWPERH